VTENICECSVYLWVKFVQILGFEINPFCGEEFVDEIIIYGKRKFAYATVSGEAEGNEPLKWQIKNVSVGKVRKESEKGIL